MRMLNTFLSELTTQSNTALSFNENEKKITTRMNIVFKSICTYVRLNYAYFRATYLWNTLNCLQRS